MGKRRKHHGLRLRLMLLVVACATGCSRPVGLQGSGDNQAPDPQTVPFHQDTDANAAGNVASRPGAPGSANQEEGDEADVKGVPFKVDTSRVLPPGTMLTIRLGSSLSSGRLDTGRTFIGAVDDPVVVGASTIISRNASVQGRVESVRVSDLRHDAGYVRLTLESIRIGDKNVPLQTSSLFARGTVGAYADRSGTAPHSPQSQLTPPAYVRLKKGRRLTFRLIEPVNIGNGEEPISRRQSLEEKRPLTNQ